MAETITAPETPDKPAPPVETKEEIRRGRGVFRFFDGARWYFGDARHIQIQLYCELGDYRAVFAAAQSEDRAVSRPALKLLSEAARKAFPLPPFNPEDGTGATEEHIRDALAALWEALGHLTEARADGRQQRPA